MFTSFSLSRWCCFGFFWLIVHKTFRLVLKSSFCLYLTSSPWTNSWGRINMKLDLLLFLQQRQQSSKMPFFCGKARESNLNTSLLLITYCIHPLQKENTLHSSSRDLQIQLLKINTCLNPLFSGGKK